MSEPLDLDEIEARADLLKMWALSRSETPAGVVDAFRSDVPNLLAEVRRLRRVAKAAQDVADTAFAVCQHEVAGTPLHKPMQRLIDTLSREGVRLDA